MNNPNLEQQAIQELQKEVELAKSLERLENNPDFIAVIKNGYIMDTLVKESQFMLDINPAVRQEALEKVQSVNYLRKKLTDVKTAGEKAAQQLAEGFN